MERRIRYIEGEQLKAWRPEGASHLRIEILDDQTILSARVKRAFPLSGKDSLFSLQNSNDEEIAIVRSLNGADEGTQALILEEFDRRYFSPQITKIKAMKQVPGMLSFDVDTNRGSIVFYVRNWRESAYEVDPNRWHITSVDGQRFEIMDLDELDRRSQEIVEELL